MKVNYKKFIVSFLTGVLLTPFLGFWSPVKADWFDYDHPEAWQVLAFEYWNRMGFNLVHQDLDPAGNGINYYQNTISGNISVPSYNINIYSNAPYENVTSHTETVNQKLYLPLNTGYYVNWMSGSYIHDNGHVSNSRDLYIEANGDLYISFVSNTNPYNGSQVYPATAVQENRHMKVYVREAQTYLMQMDRILDSEISGMVYVTYKIHNYDEIRHWVSIDFPRFSNSTKIIPVYVGSGNDVDDSIKQSLGISTKTETYLSSIDNKMDQYHTDLSNINNNIVYLNNNENQNHLLLRNLISQGNQSTSNTVNNLSDQNLALDSSISSYDNLEASYNDQMDLALNDIDLSPGIINQTGFLNAATWVGAQFNRLVLNTPFELALTFSMVLGLGLVIVGKMRG